MQILVATGNKGKLAEYKGLLVDLPIDWLTLHDIGLSDMDVEETGNTFEENAILKVKAYAEASGLFTMADDSGLVVDALDGAPGIYSARYGAPEVVTDQGRCEKLLGEMEGVVNRSARFVCVIAIAVPGREIQLAHGVWEGEIAHERRGTNGFGYDPIFVTKSGRTFAELPTEEKNKISHRALALRAAKPILETAINASDQS